MIGAPAHPAGMKTALGSRRENTVWARNPESGESAPITWAERSAIHAVLRAPARCRPEVGGPLPAVLSGVGGRSADYECGLAVGSRKPHAVSTCQFRWLLAMQSDPMERTLGL